MSIGPPPKVAIIIPTHDRPEYLAEAVRSARAQTHAQLQIAISDDGSTNPELLALLDHYEDEGLMVFRHPRGGIGSSLNAAVRAVDADYVLRLDDDDLIDPPYVEEAVSVAEADPEVGIVYCRATVFGKIDEPWELPDFKIGRILFDNLIFATALVKRDDWLTVGGYDETMRDGREDHDFILRILGLGRRVERLEGRYFHYRRHGGASVNDAVGADREALIRAHSAIFRNNINLYADHAEEFWRLLFLQVDEVNNFRHRYQKMEKIRREHPRLVNFTKASRRTLRSWFRH